VIVVGGKGKCEEFAELGAGGVGRGGKILVSKKGERVGDGDGDVGSRK